MNNELTFGVPDSDVDVTGNFMPTTFIVKRRLMSLAHRLAEAAPDWTEKTQPQHSVSRATKERLKEGISLSVATPPHQEVRPLIK